MPGALRVIVVAAIILAAPAFGQTICPPGTQSTCRGPGPIEANSRLALVLVRTTFVSIGQAIETGNYSMLRDLAAPGFRKRYSEAGLEAALAPVRDASVPLGDAVLVVPTIDTFDRRDDGLAEIAGTWPSASRPLHFRFLFQSGAGAWQLLGFDVSQAVDDTSTKTSP